MKSNQEHPLIQTKKLDPHTGTSLLIKKNQVLHVTVIQGGQVVDLVSYSEKNSWEYLSSPRTVDYNNKIYFTNGDILYSDQSRPMWTIIDDMVGKHCFLFAPCDQKMFELSYDVSGPHPNCLENLTASLSPFGIQSERIFIPFNIFMNAEITENGEIVIMPPLSKPGDFIILRADMDMIVGISACSAYKANNYSFGPIRLDVFAAK
jgi:uncharacterized protein YcgI (DUF1989 family)